MNTRLIVLVLLSASVLWSGCGGETVSRQLGAACAEPRDCDDRCLAPSAQFPGGFCTRDCVADEDCGGAACMDLAGGVCLFSCTEDADCRFLGTSAGRSWVCRSTPGKGGGDSSVCVGK